MLPRRPRGTRAHEPVAAVAAGDGGQELQPRGEQQSARGQHALPVAGAGAGPGLLLLGVLLFPQQLDVRGARVPDEPDGGQDEHQVGDGKRDERQRHEDGGRDGRPARARAAAHRAGVAAAQASDHPGHSGHKTDGAAPDAGAHAGHGGPVQHGEDAEHDHEDAEQRLDAAQEEECVLVAGAAATLASRGHVRDRRGGGRGVEAAVVRGALDRGRAEQQAVQGACLERGGRVGWTRLDEVLGGGGRQQRRGGAGRAAARVAAGGSWRQGQGGRRRGDAAGRQLAVLWGWRRRLGHEADRRLHRRGARRAWSVRVGAGDGVHRAHE